MREITLRDEDVAVEEGAGWRQASECDRQLSGRGLDVSNDGGEVEGVHLSLCHRHAHLKATLSRHVVDGCDADCHHALLRLAEEVASAIARLCMCACVYVCVCVCVCVCGYVCMLAHWHVTDSRNEPATHWKGGKRALAAFYSAASETCPAACLWCDCECEMWPRVRGADWKTNANTNQNAKLNATCQ